MAGMYIFEENNVNCTSSRHTFFDYIMNPTRCKGQLRFATLTFKGGPREDWSKLSKIVVRNGQERSQLSKLVVKNDQNCLRGGLNCPRQKS